ncbi:MAG: hypothetical protein F7C32_01005 [Desulfurococcales archaeon]|nr:hypothetical protein [Desulfurococcales archaeon]
MAFEAFEELVEAVNLSVVGEILPGAVAASYVGLAYLLASKGTGISSQA